MKGSDLPPKFTADERYAYKWLNDSKIRGWLVNLTKEVFAVEHGYVYVSLLEFVKHKGMNP